MSKRDRSRSRKKDRSIHKKEKKKKHSRSRSNKKKRSRSRDHKKRDKRSASRDRWRNDKFEDKPDRQKSEQNTKIKVSSKKQNNPIVPDVAPEPMDPNADPILQLFGFSSFTTTKGQDHKQSSVECVMKTTKLKRKYRQYMCRRGGFNRILDSV